MYETMGEIILCCKAQLTMAKLLHIFHWNQWYFPVSIIRPWLLIFSATKSPCGRPYYDLVANFLILHFPMWSLIMTWLLISFWDLQQKLPKKMPTLSGWNQTKSAKIKSLSEGTPKCTQHGCQIWVVPNYNVKNLPI